MTSCLVLRRWMRRHRAVLGVAAALWLLGAIAGVASVRRIVHERQRDQQRLVETTHRTAAEGALTSC